MDEESLCLSMQSVYTSATQVPEMWGEKSTHVYSHIPVVFNFHTTFLVDFPAPWVTKPMQQRKDHIDLQLP